MINKDLRYNLFCPYIDLSEPKDISPLHCYGVNYVFQELYRWIEIPRIQAVIMPSFRSELINSLNLNFTYKTIDDLLNSDINTKEWLLLKDYVNNFLSYDNLKKSKILRLLNKLCLYEITTELTDWIEFNNIWTDENLDEIYYQRILSSYINFVDTWNYWNYNLDFFKQIAVYWVKWSLVRINSVYQMIIQNVKHNYDINEVEKWSNIYEKELLFIKWLVDDFTYIQLKCRYYRVTAFIPQMKWDKKWVVEIMDLSEKFARELFEFKSNDLFLNNSYKILAKEMLYPVLESRIQECLWLKDFARAEKYAKELVSISPTDARWHLHYWEILFTLNKFKEALHEYQKAILFSPPWIEVAYYMAWLCSKELWDIETSDFYFSLSFLSDSEWISSVEQILNSDLINTNWTISNSLYDFFKNVSLDLWVQNNLVKNYQVEQLWEKSNN